jgi:phage tail P2-like protein
MSDCVSLLPPNSTDTERAIECATARLADVPVPLRSLWDPATCPANLLPWLAWALSVDEWDPGWSNDQQRGVLSAAYSVHQKKGTRYALQQALGGLGYGVDVVEWYDDDPVAAPYTFRLIAQIDQTPMPSIKVYQSLARVANSAKNVRSHLDSVALAGVTQGLIYVGAACLVGETVTLSAEAA